MVGASVASIGRRLNSPRRPARLHYRDMLERLLHLSVLDPVTGCWIWIGARDRKGYGSLNERRNGRSVKHWAHRLAFELFRCDRIPYGFQVDHVCRNPSCVNPDHFEAVPLVTNRGRQAQAYYDERPVVRDWELVLPALDMVALVDWSDDAGFVALECEVAA